MTLANSLLSLPLDPTHTDRDVDCVVAHVREFFSR